MDVFGTIKTSLKAKYANWTFNTILANSTKDFGFDCLVIIECYKNIEKYK